MSITELMEHLSRGHIVEEQNGSLDANTRHYNYVYYKRSTNPKGWVLIAGFNEPVDDPFKINFKGKYYPIPIRLHGHSHKVISANMKPSKPKDMNVLSFI